MSATVTPGGSIAVPFNVRGGFDDPQSQDSITEVMVQVNGVDDPSIAVSTIVSSPDVVNAVFIVPADAIVGTDYNVRLVAVIEGVESPLTKEAGTVGESLGEVKAKLDEIHAKLEDALPTQPVVCVGKCDNSITIIRCHSYGSGDLEIDVQQDITGATVTFELLGETYTGEANGNIASILMTTAQTEAMQETTHERPQYRLKIVNGGDTRVVVGTAEVI